VIDGAPVGKGRPRFVRQSGQVYTPPRTANYEAVLQWAAQLAMAGRAPLTGPLAAILTAYMPTAPSWSKKKLAAALAGEIRPRLPDWDNLAKATDALNGVVWRDDSQVADGRVIKLYSDRPRLEIEVSLL
jgi:Holliday junction resolvase RusA-like endonuclease